MSPFVTSFFILYCNTSIVNLHVTKKHDTAGIDKSKRRDYNIYKLNGDLSAAEIIKRGERKMPKITLNWKTLTGFVTDAFVAVGVPRNDALICTDVLLESDRRGIESHGVNRFKPIYIDRIEAKIQNPVTNFEVVRETPTTAVVDGHDGMGQVIGYKSMSMAIDKAKKYGMDMVAVRNSCHYGIAGYYATMATKEGMIGITGTNARPSIAPTFGVENMLGTNPLAF